MDVNKQILDNSNSDMKNTLSNIIFYSPFFLVVFVLSLGFAYQNTKGYLYLVIIIVICALRCGIYNMNGWDNLTNNSSCNKLTFGNYGNSSFSGFIFAFTIVYLVFPMFYNGDINIPIIVVLLFYFFFDLFIRKSYNCINVSDLSLNILSGILLSSLIVSLMYGMGLSNYLFFNELSSDVEMCSMPSKQTFKCSVYKNGELLGDV
jgi:hypothetical protein